MSKVAEKQKAKRRKFIQNYIEKEIAGFENNYGHNPPQEFIDMVTTDAMFNANKKYGTEYEIDKRNGVKVETEEEIVRGIKRNQGQYDSDEDSLEACEKCGKRKR